MPGPQSPTADRHTVSHPPRAAWNPTLLLHISRVPFVRPLLVALVSVGCLEQLLRDGERCFQVALDAISCG